VAHGHGWITGRLDDDLYLRMGDQASHVIRHKGRAPIDCFAKAPSRIAVRLPTHAFQRLLRARDVDVADAHNMHPFDARGLRQEHRGELAGANYPNPHRLAGSSASAEKSIKTHYFILLVMSVSRPYGRILREQNF